MSSYNILIAGQTTWTGGAANHDWFNPANWDNGVPTPSDSVFIAVDSVNMNGVISVEHINLASGARLVVTPTGSLSLSNSVTAVESTDAAIYNYGIVDIQVPMGEGLLLKGSSVFTNFNAARLIVFGSDSTSILTETDAVIRNQSGGLILVQSCKESIMNNGTIDNRGSIQILFSQKTALFSSGLLDNKGALSIDSSASDAGLVIEETGEFINSDTLIIDRIEKEVIVVKGDFKNMNGAYVGLSGSKLTDGVEIQPGGRWNNRGKLFIANMSGGGIENSGTLINFDSIIITQTAVGIEIVDTLLNRANGVIDIHHLNNGTGIDLSSIMINEGTILIEDGISDGINAGSNTKIENYGSISMTQLTGVGLFYIDTLINGAGALLKIVDAAERGILHQNGLISNHGKIEINTMGLEGIGISGGEVMNYDTMIMSNIGTDGIYMEGGIFNNQPGAYCNIHDITRDGIVLDDSNVKVVNSGQLSIETTDSWGIDLDLGKLENNGILNVSDVAFRGISVDDSLINTASGVIEVWDVNLASDAGIFNNNEGDIVNEGVINIHDIPSNGFENDGTILNNDSIIIRNVEGRAFENNVRLINNGVIDVQNVTSGIIHSGMDSLINNGFLHVRNSSFYGLFIVGHFENHDSVVVAISSPGINSWDTLYNDLSGVIEVTVENGNTCMNHTGYLQNDGAISCITTDLSGGRPHKGRDNGAGIDVMTNSFWLNTASSTLLIDGSNGIVTALNIEHGAEFIMLGEMSAFKTGVE